jgi:uncharacterized repeat protein (TIGR01451 family)
MRSHPRSLVVLVFALAALALPAAASAHGSPGPTLSVTVAHTPSTVSASTPLMTAYFSSTVTVKNTGKKTVKGVDLADAPPAGSTPVSATPSQGTCTLGAEVKCDLGSLASGATATVSISFTSPSTAGTATNTVKVASDGHGHGLLSRFFPKNGGVTVVDKITFELANGDVTSWLPAATGGDITTSTTADEDTSASRPQVSGAIIPAQPAGETVVLKYNPAPFACPKYTICRNGQWTEAHIDNTSGQPLQFELRWDASLIPYKQTTSNFVVLYRKTLDGPTLVISCHCDATASNRPCLKNVKKYADGDFSVVVVKDDNGYMR